MIVKQSNLLSTQAHALILLVILLSTLLPMPAVAQEPEPAEDATSSSIAGNYIHSLLIDKQMPLLGIRWHGDVFVDAPLNSEPADAAVTLRRAQVSLSRRFGEKWAGKFTLKYNKEGKVEPGDNYARYSGFKTSVIKMGIFDPSFSLESMSASAGLTFMEGALPVAALSENKSGGVGILKRTNNSILNAGFFFLNTSQDDQTQPGKAIVMRYVHSPTNFLLNKDIHFGASLSYRFNTDPADTEFKSRPEVATSDDYYVDTSPIDAADKVIRLGLEAHKEWERLSWQSEILLTKVQRTGLDSINFWGAYAYLSWFLTDDRRNYDSGSGTFSALVPSNPLGKGGRGAWELALRASYVDLTDKDVIGGVQSNVTLGLNWYLNANFRVMTNLIKVLDVDRPGSEFDGLDPLIFSVRLQWQLL